MLTVHTEIRIVQVKIRKSVSRLFVEFILLAPFTFRLPTMSGEPATAAAASSSEIQEKFSAEVVRAALNLLKLNQENLIDQSNSSFHDPEVGLQSMLKYLNYSNPNLAQNLVPTYEGVPDSVEFEVDPHNVTQR